MSVKRVNEDMLSKDQSNKDETLSTVIFIEQSLSLLSLYNARVNGDHIRAYVPANLVTSRP